MRIDRTDCLFFAIFFAIFLRPTEQICPDSAGPFIVSILLALLFSLLRRTLTPAPLKKAAQPTTRELTAQNHPDLAATAETEKSSSREVFPPTSSIAVSSRRDDPSKRAFSSIDNDRCKISPSTMALPISLTRLA